MWGGGGGCFKQNPARLCHVAFEVASPLSLVVSRGLFAKNEAIKPLLSIEIPHGGGGYDNALDKPGLKKKKQQQQPLELEVSARPLAQASVKTVWRVQVTDHSPELASTIIISRIYYLK